MVAVPSRKHPWMAFEATLRAYSVRWRFVAHRWLACSEARAGYAHAQER